MINRCRLITTRALIATLATAAAALMSPHSAFAQPRLSASSADVAPQQNVPAPVQQATADIEEAARRFGFGVRGGVGLDPELIDFGAHATFGPIFTRNVSFRPGIEFGIGEVTTLFGVNLDVLYTLPGATAQTRWTPYVGAGPNFSMSHRGFSTQEGDKVSVDGTTTTTTSTDTPSRFNFSDTDFQSGFNFVAGARSRSGVFFEMNATAYGVSNIRLLGGFNF